MWVTILSFGNKKKCKISQPSLFCPSLQQVSFNLQKTSLISSQTTVDFMWGEHDNPKLFYAVHVNAAVCIGECVYVCALKGKQMSFLRREERSY